jgi:hypothetical protein
MFDDDGKVEVGTEGNNSRACCGSENERVLVGSDGDFHGPKIDSTRGHSQIMSTSNNHYL